MHVPRIRGETLIFVDMILLWSRRTIYGAIDSSLRFQLHEEDKHERPSEIWGPGPWQIYEYVRSQGRKYCYSSTRF